MISIGTSITATGAIKYFKSDLENQTSDEDDFPIIKSRIGDDEKDEPEGSMPLDGDVSAGTNGFILSGTFTSWQGEIAEEFGLSGKVRQKEFNRLCKGQHPHTRDQLIRYVKPRTKIKRSGKEYQTKTHRAGLDQTINAPKSVSLIAMKDKRVIKAHLNASFKAISAAEEFTSAKMGNVRPPEKTGKALYAAFLHFESRPDSKNGQVSPSLHCHFFQFNFTKTEEDKYRALEMRENYRSQKFVTAVYRTELVNEMFAIGYKMRLDKETNAPEVIGISRDYIEANSPRKNEIIEKAHELNINSTKIVAANYRQKKKPDKTGMIAGFNQLEKQFGFQATKTVQKAGKKTFEIKKESQKSLQNYSPENEKLTVKKRFELTVEAMDFAVNKARRDKNDGNKRHKFVSRQSLMADALNYAINKITIDDVKPEFTKRYDRGELDEFDLDRLTRKSKNDSNSAVNISEDIKTNPNPKNVLEIKIYDEQSIKSRFAIFPARENNSDDSKISESNCSEPPRRTFIGHRNGLSESYHIQSDQPTTDPRRVTSETTKEIRTETSGDREKIPALDQPAGIGSGKGVEKVENIRTETAKIRRDRAINATAGSGRKTREDDSTNFPEHLRNHAKNNDSDEESQLGIDEQKNGTGKSEQSNRTFFGSSQISRTKSGVNDKSVGKSKRGISTLRKLVEKYKRKNSERIESQRYFDTRISNSDQRFSGESIVLPAIENERNAGDDRLDTGKIKGIIRESDFTGKSRGEKVELGNKINSMVNSGFSFGDAYNDVLLGDNTRLDGQFGERKSHDRKFNETIEPIGNGETENSAEPERLDIYPRANVSRSQQFLQFATRTTAKNNTETDEKENRHTAQKTAQLINLRYFGGQLDQKITREWQTVIEKSTAADFLGELLKPSTIEEQQTTARLIEKQAGIIADKLNFPAPEITPDNLSDNLADKLTEIELINYEQVTGEHIDDKTFEILSEKNLLLTEISPSAENKKEIEEIFKELPSTPEFVSDLEARTFIALLYPESVGFDEELITRTRENVRLNEAASRETVTLIQIAYGGQPQVFSNNFKEVLANEIYYNFQSPLEVYNYLGKSEWQKTIDAFAPIMESIAKQNELIIKPPEDDNQRNKFLADFVASQFIDAYKSQNNSLHKETENRLNTELENLGNIPPNKNQKDDINNHSSNNNFQSPEFSSSLEAESYRLSKYDDDKRADKAERVISLIEEKVKTEALEKANIVRENAAGRSM